jgi:glycosyltransferase involved in cell wall biosynthesis
MPNSNAGFNLPTGRVPQGEVSKKNPDLVVFSHLRWEFVTQRPQHVIGRLAQDRRVLFVEEPIAYSAGESGTARLYEAAPNVTVLQPRIDMAHLIEELEPVLRRYLQELNFHNPALWFYSAAFQEMADRLPHSLVIYDCMDELSAFRGAPKELIDQEKNLLKRADVVFTGGKSLYDSKRVLAENVFCYPSSVDRAHFAKALAAETPLPADIRDLARPIVGYYGVIDERIDYELLREVAEKNPDVSFVMIGPVVKVSEDELPRLQNLHYLGGKSYAELPAYLKAFDIAMMPFALNESTKFISPTKTLEYIAGEKPVVSTAVYDVVRDYSEVIPIVDSAESFGRALRAFLREDEAARRQRIQRYHAILERVSWDKTVASMHANIAEALARAN